MQKGGWLSEIRRDGWKSLYSNAMSIAASDLYRILLRNGNRITMYEDVGKASFFQATNGWTINEV